MTVQTVWKGPAVLKQIHDLIGRRLDAAAIHLQNQIKQEISLPGTGGVAITRGRRRRRQRVYGLVHSKPGEPPRKQYGHLRRSITHQTDRKDLVAYVGSNLDYARYLELGTSKMLPRPYLRSTLYREMHVLKNIIVSGQLPGAANPPSWST